MRRIVDQMFVKAGMSAVTDIVETASTLTTLALATASDMVAILSASVAKRFAAAGMIEILRIDPPHRLPSYGIVLRADRAIAAATSVVLAALRAAAAPGDVPSAPAV